MKKTYKIEVDCANCANKMEDAARKTAGVADVTVNFMTQKMIVDFNEGTDPAAVMKNSANPEAAQAFLDYIATGEGRAILDECGFLMLTEAAEDAAG